MTTFRERLAKALGAAGLTAHQLDQLLGLRHGWTDSLKEPPEGRMAQLAYALGVSPRWLYHGEPTEAARRVAKEMRAKAEGKLSPEDLAKLYEHLEML